MKLTLVAKKEEVAGVTSFTFKPDENLAWKAGQYLHSVLHHEPTDDRGSDRWFTIASAPFEKDVMITTRIASENGSSFKRELVSLPLDGSIEISHVEGDFTVEDTTKEYVFIAGGIGITPFHSILKQADHDGEKIKITLLYANRDAQVPYKTELESFAANNPHLSIHFITAPQRIDDATIKALVPNVQTPLFYVSGPEPMVKSLAGVLESMGVEKNNIKLDDFPGYPAD